MVVELALIERVLLAFVSHRGLPFRDQRFPFSCQFLPNPATHLLKQTEVQSLEVQKHENTTVLIRQRNAQATFSNTGWFDTWPLAQVRYHPTKKSTTTRHREARSFFASRFFTV